MAVKISISSFVFLSNLFVEQYAAAYPEEVSCLVALDAIIGAPDAAKSYWKNVGQRIDSDLKYYSQPIKEHKSELTYEKAIDL